MNGRVYDPRLGRFLSPDPIVGDPTSSQSWNLYSYVGNNPLSYVDPTGLDPWDGCGWLCPDDIDAWWDWLNFLNSWWDHPHSGSDPYSASDYESPRSKAKKTLRALDQSVADEPADSADDERNFLDKIFGAIENGETGIPLEEILGAVLKDATEETLEEIRARGDVILSDVELSNDQAVATGSFENADSEETRVPLRPGVMVLEPTIRGTFEVSEDQLMLKDLEGVLGGFIRIKPIETITIPRHGDFQHTTGKR